MDKTRSQWPSLAAAVFLLTSTAVAAQSDPPVRVYRLDRIVVEDESMVTINPELETIARDEDGNARVTKMRNTKAQTVWDVKVTESRASAICEDRGGSPGAFGPWSPMCSMTYSWSPLPRTWVVGQEARISASVTLSMLRSFSTGTNKGLDFRTGPSGMLEVVAQPPAPAKNPLGRNAARRIVSPYLRKDGESGATEGFVDVRLADNEDRPWHVMLKLDGVGDNSILIYFHYVYAGDVGPDGTLPGTEPEAPPPTAGDPQPGGDLPPEGPGDPEARPGDPEAGSDPPGAPPEDPVGGPDPPAQPRDPSPDPRPPAPRPGDPRLGDPRPGDPRPGDPRPGDPRLSDPPLGDPRIGRPPPAPGPGGVPVDPGDPSGEIAQPWDPRGPEPWDPRVVDTLGPGMWLIAERRVVAVGEDVTVPVWLINGQGLIDMNFDVAYDAAVALAGGTVTRGNLLDGAAFEANANVAGTVQLGLVPRSGGVTAERGTVALLPFRAVGPVGSRTALRLSPRKSSIVGGRQASVSVVSGEIVVVGPDGVVPGDADGDLGVDMDDVLSALKMSVDLIPVNLAADVDGDGRVTAADARLIRERVLGRT